MPEEGGITEFIHSDDPDWKELIDEGGIYHENYQTRSEKPADDSKNIYKTAEYIAKFH